MKILGFQGEYRWLSNFWPCRVQLDGYFYPTVEHAYQAAKTNEHCVRMRIRDAATPGEAKRLGRKITPRFGWEESKLRIMAKLLCQKFGQTKFRVLLHNTGDAYIEETNTWEDTFWGVCNGKGENHLGKLIMDLREALKNKS